MKKVLLVLFNFLIVSVGIQAKGRFEAYDLGDFKLHVYYSNDGVGDVSYIIEGDNELVTMEQPLFKESVAEMDEYISKLGKPVARRISDYHTGGTGSHDVVMVEGMADFMKGEQFAGAMRKFTQSFGDALMEMPTGKILEVAYGTTQTWAGISFEFTRELNSKSPGANILIGGKVYYAHWAPTKAHVSHMRISSIEDIDVVIADMEKLLASGVELFVGGHGEAVKSDVVEFKVAYLKKMREELKGNSSAQAFVEAMKRAYPDLSGDADLEKFAEAFYN